MISFEAAREMREFETLHHNRQISPNKSCLNIPECTAAKIRVVYQLKDLMLWSGFHPRAVTPAAALSLSVLLSPPTQRWMQQVHTFSRGIAQMHSGRKKIYGIVEAGRGKGKM